jgi:two-component system, chemotaxis family, protein-glutamate methylesterase/glutaminase
MAKNFPVVCLGASAGGLDAYTRLLREIPAEAGFAVVVVNHLRRQPTMLPELLGKAASMHVQRITEGMPLERNHVYVIPPNCDLTLSDHAFHLSPLSKPYGWPSVITVFLKSLAETWTGLPVAVILSGMGPDGADALRAIKTAGGITFAQKPETAEHPGMPENAIDTGFVDFELSPEEIAHELVRIQSY